MNGFPVWRAVFLICGGITVVWGIILMIFLPNSILTAKRFTVEEKILLIGRGKQNQTVRLRLNVMLADPVSFSSGYLEPQDQVVSDSRSSGRPSDLASFPIRSFERDNQWRSGQCMFMKASSGFRSCSNIGSLANSSLRVWCRAHFSPPLWASHKVHSRSSSSWAEASSLQFSRMLAHIS